jgi:hypothetical protein
MEASQCIMLGFLYKYSVDKNGTKGEKIMKRFLTIILAIMLFSSMTVTAYAVTPTLKVPSINIPEIKVNFQLPDGFWDNYFNECELDAPVIYTAKYVHKTYYYGMNKHLEIRWNAVENAENYEVIITKADGTEATYKVTSNMFYDKKAECPKVYVEGAWISATVKVRAIGNGVNSQWSETVEISCDSLH